MSDKPDSAELLKIMVRAAQPARTYRILRRTIALISLPCCPLSSATIHISFTMLSPERIHFSTAVRARGWHGIVRNIASNFSTSFEG